MTTMFGATWDSVLSQAAIYAVAVVGLQLALQAGCFSVMHASLMGVGAYVTVYTEVTLHGPEPIQALCAVSAAALVGGVAALVLTRLDGLFFAIGTLAVGQVLSFVVQIVPKFGGAGGLSGISLAASTSSIYIVLALVTVASLLFQRSRRGLSLFVAGRDPVVAGAIGIRVRWTKLWAFTASAAVAGMAGFLFAHYVGLVQPSDLDFSAETNLLLFLVVGGVDTPWGAILGTFGIQVLLQALGVSELDRFWLFGLVVIVVIMLRPRGFLRRPARRLVGVEGAPPMRGNLGPQVFAAVARKARKQ